MKTCFRCGEEQPFSEFYKHKMMADGYLGKCKSCTKADTMKNRADKLAYYRAYDRERGTTERRIASRKKNGPNWKRTDKYKANAHKKVRAAVLNGTIVRKPCEVCGETKHIHAHHDDYEKPLDVMWLCAFHHAERHLQLRGGIVIEKKPGHH